MLLKNTLKPLLLIATLFYSMQLVHAHQGGHSHDHKPIAKKLLTSELAFLPGMEVIVSEVTIPPNTELPKHWHPGEEYAYVINGSVMLWKENSKPLIVNAGETVKIPLKKVHTAITRKEGATIVVFRIHEQGKPERVLVEK